MSFQPPSLPLTRDMMQQALPTSPISVVTTPSFQIISPRMQHMEQMYQTMGTPMQQPLMSLSGSFASCVSQSATPIGSPLMSPTSTPMSPTMLTPGMPPMCPSSSAQLRAQSSYSLASATARDGSIEQVMTVRLGKYVPLATNPNETLEEKNFRHALPPRLLHKHKAWVQSQIGTQCEIEVNIPPGLVELSRKRLSRGDSRYRGLADMKIEAKIIGHFDPAWALAVLDDLFANNRRSVKCSRRRCFEVINSVKHLTETTGAFVISRPVDECVDVYGPKHVVDSAIQYLMSMQSQSEVSKRVIAVSVAAASAVIKARRTILPRDQVCYNS
ncbi:hypothetical protein DIPPA_15153, partial [Diplonema papillatum]